jgi:propanediol dehydratase large subunit
LRKTKGNQAQVTNTKDYPIQLVADAATAALLGFNEVETTMRVARNSWSNALAWMIGAAVGKGDVLLQCTVEEAEDIKFGNCWPDILRRNKLSKRYRNSICRWR